MPVLDVKNLRVAFETPYGVVQAVDQVSFRLEEGETLGIVGESGSGKSVTGLALLGLVPRPPGVIESGEAWMGGQNLLALGERAMRSLRGSQISMIFQDPMTALNPFLTIGLQLTEVLEVHRATPRSEARRKAAAALGEVGFSEPETRLDQYPHELSGGMRQRAMIAMALLCEPRVLFADEPTTALDVTIQAQILDLLADLQRRHGTAIVLITHDLGIVADVADRIHVMYAGRMIETASTTEVFERPMHPYTLGLLQSVPRLSSPLGEPLLQIAGQPPDPSDLPRGCAFAPRCALVTDHCKLERPPLAGLPTEIVDPELRERAQQRARQRIGRNTNLFLGGRQSACFELERQGQAAGEFRGQTSTRRQALRASVASRTRGRPD